MQACNISVSITDEKDIVANLGAGRAFHRTHLVRGKEKKKLAPPLPTNTGKKNRGERGVGATIYRQGRSIGPGSWHEPGPKLRGMPRGPALELWSRFVPRTGTNAPNRTGTNAPRGPGSSNRDQCQALVPVFA